MFVTVLAHIHTRSACPVLSPNQTHGQLEQHLDEFLFGASVGQCVRPKPSRLIGACVFSGRNCDSRCTYSIIETNPGTCCIVFGPDSAAVLTHSTSALPHTPTDTSHAINTPSRGRLRASEDFVGLDPFPGHTPHAAPVVVCPLRVHIDTYVYINTPLRLPFLSFLCPPWLLSTLFIAHTSRFLRNKSGQTCLHLVIHT